MKKIWIGFLILSAVAPFIAKAEDSSSGCGIGWKVTNGTTFLGITTRGVTHVTVPPTWGMTSGTSGCARHSIAKNEEAAAIYAVSNVDSLSIEMAEGRGEFLQGFARTMGCNDSSYSAFSRMTQKNYQAIVPANPSSGIEIFLNVREQIRKDPELAASCKTV